MFICEFYENFKSNVFIGHLRATAPANTFINPFVPNATFLYSLRKLSLLNLSLLNLLSLLSLSLLNLLSQPFSTP